MPEQNTTAAQGQATKPPVVHSAGLPEQGELPDFFKKQLGIESGIDGAGAGQGAAETQAAAVDTATQQAGEKTEPGTNGQAATTAEAAQQAAAPELNDDVIKTYLESKGIQFNGDYDALKAKLTAPDSKVELTPEQKAQEEATLEKRMLDIHLKNNGTIESFTAYKQLASMDLKTLSDAQIRKELKDHGFTDTEIDGAIKELYYQLNLDELERGDDESEEDFSKRKELLNKKVTYGLKQFEGRGSNTKANAEAVLQDLREAVRLEDLQNQREAKILSTVDEISQKIPRKLTLDLGEHDNSKIPPVTYDVSEAHVADVVSTLKDPAKRKQFLFNEDGSFNLSNLMDVMLRSKSLESAVKYGVIEGGNRQVAIFNSRFPDSPHALGTGGSTTDKGARKGVLARAGEPEFAAPPNKK